MRIRLPLAVLFATVFGCSMHIAPAQAQRVFVSATGSDGNPCTFVSPCRSFQHAHDTVAANGEIDVLDPAGYGALTISKAISIQGHGFSGITATAGNAININAGVNDKINLRGLLLDGGHTGTNGINFTTGAILNIEDSQIRNFAGDGIFFGPPTPTSNPANAINLFVLNTVISDNGVNGVSIGPFDGAPFTQAVLDHVQLVGNASNGVAAFGKVSAPIAVLVSNSVSAFNGSNGVLAQGGGLDNEVMVQNSSIFSNLGNGILVNNFNATIRVTKSTINNNSQNLHFSNGGTLMSFGDNSLDANGNIDGAASVTNPLK
jgi:hypothetical protein